jgi:hypothetical protein
MYVARGGALPAALGGYDLGEMNKPRIYADYLKTDDAGRLILVCYGTARDLERHRVVLESGLALTFYMDDGDAGNTDDLLVDGVVEYDEEQKRWVAVIDEATFRHASEEGTASS